MQGPSTAARKDQQDLLNPQKSQNPLPPVHQQRANQYYKCQLCIPGLAIFKGRLLAAVLEETGSSHGSQRHHPLHVQLTWIVSSFGAPSDSKCSKSRMSFSDWQLNMSSFNFGHLRNNITRRRLTRTRMHLSTATSAIKQSDQSKERQQLPQEGLFTCQEAGQHSGKVGIH